MSPPPDFTPDASAPSGKRIVLDDSPWVASVSFMPVERPGAMLVPPDGTWDLVFIRDEHGMRAIRTGLSTKAVRLRHTGTEEILAISFKASVKLAAVDPIASLDRGYVLPGDDRRFAIAGEKFEIPAFNNADLFVERLAKNGLIQANPAVQSILDGEPISVSARTLQRQFKLTTGMTHKRFTMIERARLAAANLRQGKTAQDVAHALGYYDQAHLINSLRDIVGQTPAQLGRLTAPRF
jgi:hypothetical protein